MSEKTSFLLEEKQQRLRLSPQNSEAAVSPLKLGERVREIRLSQSLTLEEASKRTGLARSTLSKIENEQISPTFAAVSKLVQGLGIDIPQLFAEPKEHHGTKGRRDITLAGAGKPHPTTTYDHEILATALTGKKMLPYRTTVKARNFTDFSEWVRHDGEEFMLVLKGEVLFYTEFYQPVSLKEGDSAYYDGDMGHAIVSVSETDAIVLWVTA
ncbi:XRE family transcriptional regulator [Candidatus Sororendozoicomonas aggregata]|uniref:helix-turn-helix domain-containing protein n=1 Tax=Candidatus Sororendozoicomonas aggregata TaxID=3073239 RepID=UPI002ED1D815